MRAEQPLTITPRRNIMALPIVFTQTRTVELLRVDGLAADDFTDFLAGTGYVVTRTTADSVGILHKEGEIPASAGRFIFPKENAYIVKVDGKITGSYDSGVVFYAYPGLAPAE
jgi:hypothetical protein